METKNEIVEFLEKELAEAEEMLEKYNYTDDEKATQYLIMANQLNYILEEIEEPAVEEPVAKVLVEMPKKEKQKRNFLTIYLNIFSVVVFFTSLFFVEDCISYLVERFVFLEGIFSALLHYGYLLIHGLSYYFLITKTKLLNLDNLDKR